MGFKFFDFGKTSDELTADRGFTGSNVTDDDIQAPAQSEGELEFLKTFKVLGGLEEKIRIRGV